jgi:hypothetical protein
VLAGLAVVAGGCGERGPTVAIRDPPARLALDPPSALVVPDSCPVYAPGGDGDGADAPFPSGYSAICAVDETGAAYGLAGGESGALAVVPGGRELGVYLGFEPGSGLQAQFAHLSGDDAGFRMWAAPSNVLTPDCCAEAHPEGRLTIRAVASGPQGVLLSAGRFDRLPLQISGRPSFYGDSSTGAMYRFYVNAPP